MEKENNKLIVQKESIFKKIINKIKNLFNTNNKQQENNEIQNEDNSFKNKIKVSLEPTLNVEKESTKKRQKMFYELNGIKYEIPFSFTDTYFNHQDEENIKKIPYIPSKTNDESNYIIDTSKMTEEDKNKMLKTLIDISLNEISMYTYMETEFDPNSELATTFPALTRKAHMKDYVANQMMNEGKIEDANHKLEEMVEEVLKFYKSIKENDKEQTR